MTLFVKCNNCNVVIDELLAYVQNKLSIIDENSLVRICVSAFQSDEIKRSKQLLFESLPTEKRKINRKKLGKESRDLEDIISLLKGTNPELIPVFVARDLEKLPPITFDHLDVTKLLKDLLLVQSEIKDIKNQYATKEHLEQVKDDMLKINSAPVLADSMSVPSRFRSINVNMNKRGGYFDSGPIGLSLLNTTVKDDYRCDESHSSSLRQNSDLLTQKYPPTNLKTCEKSCVAANEPVAAVPVMTSHCMNSAHETGLIGIERPEQQLFAVPTTTIDNDSASKTQSHVSPKRSVEGQHSINTNVSISNNNSSASKSEFRTSPPSYKDVLTDGEGEFQKVHHRKSRNDKKSYRYAGQMGCASQNECNFKAADTRIPIFITNVHRETTIKDISDYIHNKTQERVTLEKISIKRDKGHNAFKFFVSEQKLSLFLEVSLWPKGIIFRRFVHYNDRVNKEVGSSNAGSGANNLDGR